MATWSFGLKSNVAGVPTLRSSTLPSSVGAMGASGWVRLGSGRAVCLSSSSSLSCSSLSAISA